MKNKIYHRMKDVEQDFFPQTYKEKYDKKKSIIEEILDD